jgi:hypothetical protein
MVWWLGVFVVVQQAARMYLIREAWSRDPPDAALLIRTIWVGLRADLIMAAAGLLIAVLAAGLAWSVSTIVFRGEQHSVKAKEYSTRSFLSVCWSLMVFLILCLTVDMGYYHYNTQHLDFVFFEYLDDLWAQEEVKDQQGVQATRQTYAEMGEGAKWGPRLFLFFSFLGGAVLLWRTFYARIVSPFMDSMAGIPAIVGNLVILIGLSLALLGFHPKGPTAIRTAAISNGTYYTLAQNPILYAGEALRAMLDSRLQERSRARMGTGLDGDWVELPSLQGDRAVHGSDSVTVSKEEAVRVAQDLLARGGTFPLPDYPFVRRAVPKTSASLQRPPNVLLLFVEALDRRYVGGTVPVPRVGTLVNSPAAPHGPADLQTVALTPFLDQLKGDSLYFENFFSNGAQTARGLFASLCSYFPRRGMSVMKTRYAQDFLCLPSVLAREGYATEMVISAHRDVDRLHLFMSRNGMQRVFDETDFPSSIERMGAGSSLGIPDGPLLDFVRERLLVLKTGNRPFFLTVKTLTTHHPFSVPQGDDLIEALRRDPDGYPAALRYFDQEFGRFFSRATAEGLLENTLVFILGDHGRHEHVGEGALEKQMGHFLTPLYVWVAPSLRGQVPIRPRTVPTVASQVDLPPTILSMTGLLPMETPFLGQDLSCLLMEDCLRDNFAFLISPYGDEVIGLADRNGILLYGLRTEAFTWTDLALARVQASGLLGDRRMADRSRHLLSLYYSANAVLDRNRVWPMQEMRARL